MPDTTEWLRPYSSNITSQSGEDGIIEMLFDRVGAPATPWCVELGAWDGRHFSNSWNLITNRGWSAVLIEADRGRFEQLRGHHAGRTGVHALCEWVDFEGDRSLDALLARTPLPPTFDLLSLDVDGNDYHLWAALTRFRPKVVVIEFNPMIPNSVDFVQPRDMRVRQGSSLRAMTRLGRDKGYELLGVSGCNGLFIEKEYLPRLPIPDASLDALRPEIRSAWFQLYDGTIVLDGPDRLVWHDFIFYPERVQVLPRFLRVFPDGSRTLRQRLLMRLYRLLFERR